MHPKPSELTQEQRETIEYWLKIAGSPGKGCRSDQKQDESGRNREIYRVFGVPSQYFAETGDDDLER
jgi:hypothetical protein